MAVAVSQWHWMDRGRKMGPVSWGELQSLARRGKLKPTDMVLREGSSNWQPARAAREAQESSADSGTAPAAAPAAVARTPYATAPVEEGLDMAGLAPRGLRPVRMFIGLAMIGGGIVASMASFDAALRRGGGEYLIFVGPMIWGVILVLTSLGVRMKRYDE